MEISETRDYRCEAKRDSPLSVSCMDISTEVNLLGMQELMGDDL